MEHSAPSSPATDPLSDQASFTPRPPGISSGPVKRSSFLLFLLIPPEEFMYTYVHVTDCKVQSLNPLIWSACPIAGAHIVTSPLHPNRGDLIEETI